MALNLGPQILYHGCDDSSATSIMTSVNPNQHGINLAYSALLTDFGQGFYTTTYLDQAKSWANQRCLKIMTAPSSKILRAFRGLFQSPKQVLATVLRFEVDRDKISKLQWLSFVREDRDYWQLVQYCRQGQGTHHTSGNYDIVTGPVSLWPQGFVIKDCDQISFHTPRALAILPAPIIEVQGTTSDPFLR